MTTGTRASNEALSGGEEKMDRLRAMEIFVQAVDAGSFSAASRNLNTSVASVTRYVAHLEERLGIRLIQRSSRKLSLTEGGSAYYTPCRQILDDLADADSEVGATAVQPTGVIKLSVPVSFGIHHLAPRWPDFLARYPDISLELSVTDRLVDLLEDGFDAAIRVGRLIDSSLVARKLAPARMVVCAAPAYLARHGTPDTVASLAEHRCLSNSYMTPGDDWTLCRQDEACKVRVAGRVHANNGDTLRAAALAGQGIIAQPSFLVGPDLAAGRLVELLPGWEMQELGIYAIYPSRRHMSAKLRVLLDYLAQAFGPTPDWDNWPVLASASASD
jgi:DNA-binding transcriptional LysR family regulator